MPRYTLSVQCFAASAPFLGYLNCAMLPSRNGSRLTRAKTRARVTRRRYAPFSHSPPREFRDHPVYPFGLGCAWVRRWKGRRLNHMGGAEGPGYRPGAAICTPQGEQPSELAFALRETRGWNFVRGCALSLLLIHLFVLFIYFLFLIFLSFYILYFMSFFDPIKLH